MYGIDANIAQPPFSAIISILLVVACDYLGLYVIRKYLKTDVTYLKWIRWQAPTIGVALLSIIIYPMALIGVAHRSELRLIARLMIAVSVVHIFKFVKSRKYIASNTCVCMTYMRFIINVIERCCKIKF